jgi:hypothetical protein
MIINIILSFLNGVLGGDEARDRRGVAAEPTGCPTEQTKLRRCPAQS